MEISKEEEEIVMDLATISCNKDRDVWLRVRLIFFWGGGENPKTHSWFKIIWILHHRKKAKSENRVFSIIEMLGALFKILDFK